MCIFASVMLQKYVGIVLHTVKYNDKANIVHVYTEQSGRMSFLIPAQRSRKSAVKQVLFQPLSVVEFEADMRPRSGIHPIKEAKAWYVFTSLPYDPYKSAIAMFLAEFLYRALKEETTNIPLFAYLVHSVQWLDVCETSFANFHLVFLLRLLHYLGIYPNVESYVAGSCFDMLNGVFVDRIPMHRHYLNRQESVVLARLLKISFENMSLYSFSRQDRVSVINRILEYYRLHLPDFPEIKSLSVMQSLFD